MQFEKVTVLLDCVKFSSHFHLKQIFFWCMGEYPTSDQGLEALCAKPDSLSSLLLTIITFFNLYKIFS